MEGIKYDSGKPRWELVPYEALEGLVKVLTLGTKKYKDDNWKYVENGKERYFGALMRHLVAWRSGIEFDEETGLSHLDHALANLTFINYLDKVDHERRRKESNEGQV